MTCLKAIIFLFICMKLQITYEITADSHDDKSLHLQSCNYNKTRHIPQALTTTAPNSEIHDIMI